MPRREQRARKLGIPIDQMRDGRGKNPNSWNNTPHGSAHHRWNGEKIIDDDGYVKLRVGVEHPHADPNEYAYEHLIVWCSAGNPRPVKGKMLHHRNEDKADNRLDNLELLTRSGHNALHNAERGRRSNGQQAARGELDGRTWDEFPARTA